MRKTTVVAMLLILPTALLAAGCKTFVGGAGTVQDPYRAYLKSDTPNAHPAVLRLWNQDQNLPRQDRAFIEVDETKIPPDVRIIELAPGRHQIVVGQSFEDHASSHQYLTNLSGKMEHDFFSGKTYYVVARTEVDADAVSHRTLTVRFYIAESRVGEAGPNDDP